MATPMSADKLLSQLRKWGVRYEEYGNWRTHNRNHMGAWGPVHGLMVHHTGSDSRDQRALLRDGVSGLPGPLAQFGLAQDGTVHLIGHGRANHAGAGDPDVLAAVINESYGQRPPADNQSSVDGNARFYGVEIWYSGSHKMTDAQYAALRKLSAAICDAHGWSAKSVIGHGEWGSPGKWDPGHAPGKMMDMSAVRDDIAATLSGQADKPTEPAPDKPSTPATPKEDSMDLRDNLAVSQWMKDRWKEDKGLQDGITVATALSSGYGQARRAADNTDLILAKLTAQQATIDKLVDAVAAGTSADLSALKAEIRAAIESISVRMVTTA